jgi:hypothetical protein
MGQGDEQPALQVIVLVSERYTPILLHSTSMARRRGAQGHLHGMCVMMDNSVFVHVSGNNFHESPLCLFCSCLTGSHGHVPPLTVEEFSTSAKRGAERGRGAAGSGQRGGPGGSLARPDSLR